MSHEGQVMRAPRLLVLCSILGLAVAVSWLAFTRANRPDNFPPSNLTVLEWERAWGQVLADHVDSQGRVDFSSLTQSMSSLEQVVAYIASQDPFSSPDQFPAHNHQLAYYINAYNALAMHGVLVHGIPDRLNLIDRIQFFILNKFDVGGTYISLYKFENDIIRPLGDPRVHFVLNCMSVSCPRLRQQPLTARNADLTMEAAAHEFMAQPRNVSIDHHAKTVTVSAIFNMFSSDFEKGGNSIISYINRYLVDPIPEEYTVMFFQYDWHINSQ